MQLIKWKVTLTAMAMICLIMTACAKNPLSFGDKMIQHSQSASDLGEKWNAGQKMTHKGEKFIGDGKEKIKEGERQIKDGQKLIEKGRKMMNDAEAEYKKQFPGQSLNK